MDKFFDPVAAIKHSYNKKIYDEEFYPIHLYDKDKKNLIGPIKDNDAVIFYNFRSDRARQITKAFVLASFQKF